MSVIVKVIRMNHESSRFKADTREEALQKAADFIAEECKDGASLYEYSVEVVEELNTLEVMRESGYTIQNFKPVRLMKPKLEVRNQDGNVFSVLGAVARAMRLSKEPQEKIDEMRNRVFKSGSYDEALLIMGEYVDFV